MRRWDPYDEIRELERRMSRLFREFWGRGPRLLGTGETAIEPYKGEVGIREPFTDIQESDKEIIVTAEIPGVDKRDIRINATEDRLEISAETKYEAKEEKEGYVRKERSYGRFYRALTLPATVKSQEAKASYKNGVLEVILPKVEAVKKTRVKIG